MTTQPLKINEQNNCINNLKVELVDLKKINSALEMEKDTLKQELYKVKRDLKELMEINSSMVESIRILEAQNEIYHSEMKVLEEYPTLVTESSRNPCIILEETTKEGSATVEENNYIPEKTHFFPHKRVENGKILLLCDENGRYLGKWLQQQCNNVQTIIKPGALLANVMEDIINLVNNFTLNDYVIIVGGANNFYKYNKHPPFKDIHSKIKYCTHTNIVFTSLPLKVTRINRGYNTVNKFNSKLKEYTHKLSNYSEGNVMWCEMGNYRKTQFYELLLEQMFNTKNIKNLIFVPVSKNYNVVKESESRNNFFPEPHTSAIVID